ncbi:PP2C family protein-serine/threonine phosphatase [Streptomyces sp. NPDC005262]|uniref:PP2C family protein-serine/threonine phosphatase n=1 Tax=Streptomyces sp. NPDC005262 TaxID=3364710 RepID=UPI0036C291E2
MTALSTPSPTTPSPPPAWPASNPKAPPGPCAGAPQATGHLPPLLITPGGRPKYLYADPGIPLGVDADQPRADHTHPLSAGSTVVFFTDGLIEHPQHPIDTSLDALARTAATLGDLSLNELCKALVDHHPSDGHDDMAILALRTPLAT